MSASTPDLPHCEDTRAPADAEAGVAARPGWVEILSGVAVFLLLEFGGVPLIKALGLDPTVYGLILTGWSGVAGLAGFAVARSLRVRSSTAFDVRATSWRWLAAGIGAGLLAFVLVRIASVPFALAFGTAGDVQEVYSDTGAAGPVATALTLLLLAVLTPIGEELLFRGVVTTALLRHGRAVGVVGSAAIFAAVHGPHFAALAAAIVGLINAELLRRSRSVWPGVVVHAVNNALGIGLGVLLAAAG